MTSKLTKTIELRIQGMCCMDEVEDVRKAIMALPGVSEAQVLLASEKAVVRYDPEQVDTSRLEKAVESAGCVVVSSPPASRRFDEAKLSRSLVLRIFTVFGLILGVLLFAVVLGEMFGGFDLLTERVPWPVWLPPFAPGGTPGGR